MNSNIYIIAKKSDRLNYVCHVLFNLILKKDFFIVDNYSGCVGDKVINYTNKKIDSVYSIKPFELLYKKNIERQDIRKSEWNNLPIIFASSEGDLPFDIFAASFYILSRYEEYLPSKKDNHNRFKPENSIAFKHNFIEMPIIELWTKQFAKELNIEFPNKKYKKLLTIDIDKAWKYKNNTLIRTLGAYLMYGLKGNFTNVTERLKVNLGIMPDPYDTFDILKNINQKVEVRYFTLLSNKGKFDNATPYTKKAYKKLITNLSKESQVGIHPSYESNNNIEILKNEINVLSNIIKTSVTNSRQHYLKSSYPTTFQNLLKLGIKYDYTMGWDSKVGFRAGISIPFPFFDISKNTQTDLVFVPFVAMDCSLKDYMKLSKKESLEKLYKLKELTKEVGGNFCLLCHNHSFSEYYDWKGWSNIFHKILDVDQTI